MRKHKSFGPVPADKMKEAIESPAGHAQIILRKYDPLFGRRGEGELKNFIVKVSKRCISRDTAKVEIQASNEEEAEILVSEMDWDEFSWEEAFFGMEEDDYEIDSVEEKK